MRATEFMGVRHGTSEVINLNPDAQDGAVAVLRRDFNGGRHLEIMAPTDATSAVRVKLNETEVANLIEALKRFPCQLRPTWQEVKRRGAS